MGGWEVMKQLIEKRLSLILAWGALGITLIITDRISSEPANYGKATVLTAVAGSALFLCLKDLKEIISSRRVLVVIILGLLASLLNSIFLSESSLSKGIFGTFGRSTGLLTYLSLSILFLLGSALKEKSSFLLILRGLFLAGSVNLLLSIFNILGQDLLTWQNPNLLLLGTLGNTNFVGSFLGIYLTLCISIIFFIKLNRVQLFLLLITSVVTFYAIFRTNALQGLIVSGLGSLIVLGFFIKSRFRSIYSVGFLYATLGLIAMAVLGTLQIGPLAKYLYKTSVTLRGEYWQAAINMGNANVFSGVGLDSYGANYRLYRDESALVLPGANVTTDAAHNVFLDFFAGSGLPGFLMYLILNVFILLRAIKIWRDRSYHGFIGVALVAMWIAYVAQSIVSINQIGLAVWGWVLAGLLIGYSETSKNSSDSTKVIEIAFKEFLSPFSRVVSGKSSKSADLIPASRAVASFVGLVLGLLAGLMPLINDARTRNVIESKNPDAFRAVADSWPQDTVRDYRLIVEFTKYGRDQDAYDLALESTKRFPNEFPGWFSLYQLTASDSPNKLELKNKLHQLDPRNPEWK